MPSLAETLLEIDHELAAGDGDTYRRRLADDAIVIVPSQALDKRTTAEAMDASPGWDRFAIDDATAVPLGPESALVTYRFEGHRGTDRYAALMSSVYVRQDGAWQLTLHQQTPLP